VKPPPNHLVISFHIFFPELLYFSSPSPLRLPRAVPSISFMARSDHSIVESFFPEFSLHSTFVRPLQKLPSSTKARRKSCPPFGDPRPLAPFFRLNYKIVNWPFPSSALYLTLAAFYLKNPIFVLSPPIPIFLSWFPFLGTGPPQLLTSE